MHPQESPLAEVRKVSTLAGELKGSEIIKLAGEIRERMAKGEQVYNFTIGDFDPALFPIPELLKEEIYKAYNDGHTNYPPSEGIGALRQVLSKYIGKHQGIAYSPEEFVIAGGGRPLIYAAYQAILDPDEHAVFPVPSWNNNHYATLTRGMQVAVETTPEQNFMPTAADLEPHLAKAGILALCSPLNPTGTAFGKEALLEICHLVLRENHRREGVQKPLYLLYDQIYWQLCFGDTVHYDPVSLLPELKPYTIYIDGISKSYAATGVRVGWAFGPRTVIDKMKSILGHMGAWAPKPEQVATARFMEQSDASAAYLTQIKSRLHERLEGFYRGFEALAAEGWPVAAIAPQAALYLTVKIDLRGKVKPDGTPIATVADTTGYLLSAAGLAVVPFTAFGASSGNPWYRLSVGTARTEEIATLFAKLRSALETLR
jgi:aspartate aminotransferase